MKTGQRLLLGLGLGLAAGGASAADIGTAFTYQGFLEDGGGPVTDSCDFEFELYDAAAAGSQIDGTLNEVVSVEDGLFTVGLDFGAGAFDGSGARWLDIKVCCPSGGCTLDPLGSRQELTPAPYALALPGLYTDAAGDTIASGTITSGNSITIDGTANTINSTADLALQSAGGNVGIGTTTPDQVLEVAGNILLGPDGVDSFLQGGAHAAFSADGNILIVGDSNKTSGPTPEGDIIFGAGSAKQTDGPNRDFTYDEAFPTGVPRLEHMRITGAGNVGIGTPTPQSELHLSRPNVPFIRIEDSGTGEQLDLFAGAGQTAIGSFTNHPLVSFTNNVERMRITTAGDVGIGTNSPADQLHLLSSASNRVRIETTNSPAFHFAGVIGKSPTMEYFYGACQNCFGAAVESWTIFDNVAFQTRLHIDSAGTVTVPGFLFKQGGGFHIDHPMDPANKYLNHFFVESPQMKNVYDDVAVLDGNGEAVVALPDYFEAANREFRYQLTTMGGFAPVYVAEEISGNRFKIAGGMPGMKVSWQVTGVRDDAFALANQFDVEAEKPEREKGYYLSPELFGQPNSRRIGHRMAEYLAAEAAEVAAAAEAAAAASGDRFSIADPDFIGASDASDASLEVPSREGRTVAGSDDEIATLRERLARLEALVARLSGAEGGSR